MNIVFYDDILRTANCEIQHDL